LLPPVPHIKTIEELYKTDFPQYMKVFRTITATADDENVSIGASRYIDTFARSSFISIYIPICKNPYELVSILPQYIPQLLADMDKSVQIKTTSPGDTVPTTASETTFSGRVYVYYEGQFVPREVADLLDAYSAKGYSLQLRGQEYQTSMFLAGQAGANKPQ
jgi:hypothetical protein